MADKIRLGIIGANLHRGWAMRSHLPAVVASPEFELTAVCTTRMESAEESRQAFGARLAFDDYNVMLAHPEIDAVVVSLRVPNHYEPTTAALNAGKHIYTEWPLGRTTAEAQEMADLARAKGVINMVGLQSRANPAMLYLKDLVAAGYVGEVMSCHVSRISEGGDTSEQSDRTWQRDRELGANTLTISPRPHHRRAAGSSSATSVSVATVVSTQADQWHETDTDRMVDVTSPDNILVSGRNWPAGGVASVHIASNPLGRQRLPDGNIRYAKGTLVASSDESSQPRWRTRIQGVQGGNRLEDLTIPAQYTYVLEGMPRGAPYNVGQMYYQFGRGIREGDGCQPDFDEAVRLHHFIDRIQEASERGTEVAVA